MNNTVDIKPETKTFNSVEAYNEGFLHGVSFCKKYGIPSETPSTTPIEDKGWEIVELIGKTRQKIYRKENGMQRVIICKQCLKTWYKKHLTTNENKSRTPSPHRQLP